MMSAVRWVRKRREGRESRDALVREELRQAVSQLLSRYDCQVEQKDDRITVRGQPGTSPFDIDLAGDLAVLGAGENTEFVSESVLSAPGAVDGLRDLIRQIVAGDDIDGPRSRLGNGQLTGYKSYVSRPSSETA